MKLKRKFFLQPTVKVAQHLLGKFLVHEYRGKKIFGQIVETEAYIGPEDEASHSYRGRRTKRTEIMFDEGGKAYPYLIYGVYWLFNVVTNKKEKPEAVLIRALDIARGDGPGKLSKILKLDGKLYGYDLCKANGKLFIEDRGVKIKKSDILSLPRIGIDYVGESWKFKPWRFVFRREIG